MANVKISALPAAAALDGTESFPLVQGANTEKTPGSAIATYVEGTLRQAVPTSDIIPDVITDADEIAWDLSNQIGTDHSLSATIGTHATLTSVRLASMAALPACTYANGSGAVGATLTGDAVGALAAIDFVTPAANDRILVKNQAAPAQNGIYTVTTLGSGGAAFVLTRTAESDEAVDYVDGIFVLVGAGLMNAGAVYTAGGTFTMGTTAITWRGQTRVSDSPGGGELGANRDRRKKFSDCEELQTAIVVASGATQFIPGTAWVINMAGTVSTATQVGTADVVTGAIALATGTATTGYCSLSHSNFGFTFSTTSRARFYAKIKIPTTTDGTNTFVTRIGFFNDVTGTTPTDGIYLEAPGDATNWRAVCINGSTTTGSYVDTGVAQSNFYKNLAVWYDEISLTAFFFMNISGVMTQVAAIVNTNLPSGDTLHLGVQIDKTAGTTSRLVHVDLLGFDVPDPRTLLQMVP